MAGRPASTLDFLARNLHPKVTFEPGDDEVNDLHEDRNDLLGQTASRQRKVVDEQLHREDRCPAAVQFLHRADKEHSEFGRCEPGAGRNATAGPH